MSSQALVLPAKPPVTPPPAVAQPAPKSTPAGEAVEQPDQAEVPVAPANPEPPVVEEPSYPFQEPLPNGLAPNAPATLVANLSAAECRRLVQKKKLPVKRDRRPTPGVATAMRFTGPVNGVRFLTAGWKSPYGVMDCRLVLAFEAMSEVLVKHQVTQVHVGTMYRRNSKLGSSKLSQHAHALAADIVAFKLSDDRLLTIERDFSGELGRPVCGPESRLEELSDASLALRNLVCDLARGGHFHYMLTPNYDHAHRDHLHVDVKRNAKRTVIR